MGVSDGRLLCHMAEHNPHRFFVGVELKRFPSLVAAKRARKQLLQNTIIVNMEANHYMRDWAPDSVFEVIHVYFPTPSPESIGLNERLICASFVEQAHRILKRWGTIRFVTDCREYYLEACSLFDVRRWWAVDWQPVPWPVSSGYFVGSPHEVEYREIERVPIYAVQLVSLG